MISPSVSETERDSSDRVLSVGIVGAGEIATKVHLPVISALPGVRLAYVADTNEKAAQAAADCYGGLSVVIGQDVATLPATDVVLLTTPVGTRRAYYELFAARGSAVLAEKPFAITTAEARRVISLFPPHALACGFQRRAFAGSAIARTCLEQKIFGPLRSVRLSEGGRTTKTGTDSRFYDQWGAAQGGVLRDLGSHGLDLVFFLTGATAATPIEHRFWLDDKIDRQVQASMRFTGPGGDFDAEIFLSWLHEGTNTVEFCFEGCILSVSSRADGPVQLFDRQRRPLRIALSRELGAATTTYQAFYLEWESFLAGVRQKRPGVFSAASCLPVVDAVERLYAGAKAP